MNQTLGKYRLIAELAHGGMGTVYLAVAQGPAGFNKLVVVKQLRAVFAEDANFRAMFLQEARLAAYLHHPNIVQTYEIVCDPTDGYFIVMEYLEGASLKQVVRHLRARGSTLVRAIYERAILDVLTALEYAHDLTEFDGNPLSLVHRDVNPDNILIVYGGHAKLLDFGIAKAANATQETQAGILKGKLRYMAPEQMAGDPIDRRADIFAVGVMLWDAITGRRLWEGMKGIDVMAGLVQGAIVHPRTVNPRVSEELDRICMRALAFKPVDRYPTATAFRADLERALGPDVMSVADLAATMATAFEIEGRRMRALIAQELRPVADGSHRPVSNAVSEPPAALQTAPAPPRSERAEEGSRSRASSTDANESLAGTEPEVRWRGRGWSKRVWGGLATVAACALLTTLAMSATCSRRMLTDLPSPVAEVSAPVFTAMASPAATLAPPAAGADHAGSTPALALPIAVPPIEKRGRVGAAKPRATLGAEPAAHASAPLRLAAIAVPASGAPDTDTTAVMPTPQPAMPPRDSEAAGLVTSVAATPLTPGVVPTGVATAPGPPELPKGAIAAGAIAAVVRLHAQEIQRCFDTGQADQLYLNACESMGKTPGTCRRARVMMSATVAPDGRVMQVSTSASRDGTAHLEECIRSAVESWSFPEPAGGVSGRISYPFVFE